MSPRKKKSTPFLLNPLLKPETVTHPKECRRRSFGALSPQLYAEPSLRPLTSQPIPLHNSTLPLTIWFQQQVPEFSQPVIWNLSGTPDFPGKASARERRRSPTSSAGAVALWPKRRSFWSASRAGAFSPWIIPWTTFRFSACEYFELAKPVSGSDFRIARSVCFRRKLRKICP